MSETVVLVDYGSGNLHSAAKACERAVAQAGLAACVLVSNDPAMVAAADRVILPGVGAFADCLAGLAAIDGMTDALAQAALARARPFLGICVGMQLMASRSSEHGDHAGLGWIAGTVTRLAPRDPTLKIPHMGWNELCVTDAGRAHPLLAGLGDGTHVYFVHSYAMQCADAAAVLATADYGGPVTAVVARGNLAGTQFHPEKSQTAGLRLLANFLAWRP